MPLSDDFLALIPDSLTYDDNGKPAPIKGHPFVREAPDIPTFVKNAFEAHREVGARIPVKVRDDAERADWLKNHLPKLHDAGLLPRPPASPDEFNDVVRKPEALPEGWGWNDEYAKDFKGILHKHGIPKAAVADLIALHERTLTGAGKVLKTSLDEGMAALRTKYGTDLDARIENAKRLVDVIFDTPESLAFYEELGLGNHPAFLDVLIKLAPLAQQDSSFFANQPQRATGGQASGEDVKKELADIMSNKDNPRYAPYWRGDKDVQEYINALYRKAYGDGKVELT